MSKKLEEPEVVARIRDYRQTFGTQAGRRVLADLRKSFENRSSHVAGDPYETAFREGERNVMLKLKSMLKMTEEELDRWTSTFKQTEEEEN